MKSKLKKQYKIISTLLLMISLMLVGCSESKEQPTNINKEVLPVDEIINTGIEEIVEEVKHTEEDEVRGNIEVHFIDVGQADSILVRHGDDELLIDAGNNGDGNLVVEYINKLGIEDLEYVIGTHPHEDHIGGLDDVINNIDIENIIMPKTLNTTKTYEDVLNAIQSKGLKVTSPKVGNTFKLGDAEVIILSPNNSEYTDLNNYSVALKVIYGDNKFIFTGDNELLAEHEILGNGINISANVIKLGHHGSDTSTSENFLNKVNPQYAVISVGEDNKYGHPSSEVLDRINKRNIEVFRTDLQGTIIATGNGKSISFNVSSVKNENKTDKKESTGEVSETILNVQDEGESRGNTGSNGITISNITYIGNKNSHKFHLDSCGSLPDQKNRVYLKTRDEAISQGYDPCKICNP